MLQIRWISDAERKKMFYNIIFCQKYLVGKKSCRTFALAIGK